MLELRKSLRWMQLEPMVLADLRMDGKADYIARL